MNANPISSAFVIKGLTMRNNLLLDQMCLKWILVKKKKGEIWSFDVYVPDFVLALLAD